MVHAGEGPSANQISGPVLWGIREVTRLAMTWACCTRCPHEDRPVLSAQFGTKKGAQPTKTSRSCQLCPGRKVGFLAKDPALCSPVVWVAFMAATPLWAGPAFASLTLGSKLRWSNTRGWLQSLPPHPAQPPQMMCILAKLLCARARGGGEARRDSKANFP